MAADAALKATTTVTASHAPRTLFAVTFAIASAAHVWGNPRGIPATLLVLMGAAIAATLVRPGSPWPLTALCLVIPATVWTEAPVVGNHWVLVGLVAVAWLGSVVVTLVTKRDLDGQWDLFAPAARWTLLIFYGFAAFSKLNSDFFDPAVSCALFYLDQSAASLGAGSIVSGLPGWSEYAVIVGTVAIELSVPVLLAMRRTRRIGVVVGLVFHYVLALDRFHQFVDFSTVLVALFVLFLEPDFAEWLGGRVRGLADELADRWSSGPELIGLAAAVGVGFSVALGALPGRWPVTRLTRELSIDLWLVYGLAAIVAVVAYLRRGAAPPAAGRLRLSPLLAVVPLLAFANGLTPYLEVKTAFGWNMYGNLVTVDGESNHFIVRSTLPLSDAQGDRVRIIESSDFGLQFYAEQDYELTWVRFRHYLAAHPEASVTYVRGGERVEVERVGDHPELMHRLNPLEDRLTLHRAIDVSGERRCQSFFGPAN